jgi:hypothetical protein
MGLGVEKWTHTLLISLRDMVLLGLNKCEVKKRKRERERKFRLAA